MYTTIYKDDTEIKLVSLDLDDIVIILGITYLANVQEFVNNDGDLKEAYAYISQSEGITADEVRSLILGALVLLNQLDVN